MFILVPLAMGSIARERERNTWSLLILTRLRPAEIIWQKYVAGLIPALSSVLLLFPMGALCYAVGGLEAVDVHISILLLGIAACQIGALALLCSVICQSSLGALMLTMSAAVLINVLPLSAISPFFLLREIQSGGRVPFAPCFGVMVSALLMVTAARWRVFKTPLPKGRGVLRWLFRILDGWIMRSVPAMASRWGARDERILSRRPVAWRELTRRSLCQVRHLIWITLPVLLLILGYAVWAVTYSPVAPEKTMPWLMGAIWVGSSLLLTLEAATLVTREREDQTLDVLLTTPISASEMVLQKAMALRRRHRDGGRARG